MSGHLSFISNYSGFRKISIISISNFVSDDYWARCFVRGLMGIKYGLINFFQTVQLKYR